VIIIRKSIIFFVQIAIAAFFARDWQPMLDASELDGYLFNREARMEEVWRSEPIVDRRLIARGY
jgi:hypothetical protein